MTELSTPSLDAADEPDILLVSCIILPSGMLVLFLWSNAVINISFLFKPEVCAEGAMGRLWERQTNGPPWICFVPVEGSCWRSKVVVCHTLARQTIPLSFHWQPIICLHLQLISEKFRNGDFSDEAVYYWRQHELSPISYLFSMQVVTKLSCINCGFVNHDYDDLTNHLSLGVLSNKSNSIEVR